MNHARRLDLRLVLAIAFVIAAVWAATALAGGSQPSSDDSGAGNSPAAVFVQEGDGGAPQDGAPQTGDNCPDRGGGDGGSGDGSPDV